MKKLLFLAAFIGFAASASANFVLAPSVGYNQRAVEEGILDTESTTTSLDLKLGYVLPMGLYLGGMYSYQSQEICVSGSCADGSGFNVGPTVGYFSMSGFYSLLTYHIIGEAGDDPKYTGGKGPQVDIGWVFPISSYFSIGPQLTWRSVEYDKIESGGTSVDTDRKEASISPYISLWFMF